MDDREMKQLLERAAERDVPGNVNLWPTIEQQLQQPQRQEPFAWLRARLMPVRQIARLAVAVLALLIAFVGFSLWNATLQQTAATVIGRSTATATQPDEVGSVALDEPFRLGPVTMTITGVTRTQTETIVGFHFVPRPRTEVSYIGLPNLRIDGVEVAVGGDYLAGNGIAEWTQRPETIILSYPPLPTETSVLTFEIGPLLVGTGEPATVTLDLEAVRNGGQQVEVQGRTVLASWAGLTSEGGFRLALNPFDESDADFRLIGPSDSVTIRDEHNHKYTVSGSAHGFRGNKVDHHRIFVTESLHADTDQLILSIPQTARVIPSVRLQVRLPQAEVGAVSTSTATAATWPTPQPHAIVETNPNLIVERMEALVQKQQDQLFGEPGWIHIRTQAFYPREDESYFTTGEYRFYPAGTVLWDKWYRLTTDGVVTTALSLMYTESGELQQRSIFVDDLWHNLTLWENGADREPNNWFLDEFSPLYLPGVEDLRGFAHFVKDSGGNENVTVVAQETLDEYRVTVEQTFEQIIERHRYFSVPIQARRTHYVFDLKTSRLVRFEHRFLGTNGEWMQGQSEEVLALERVPELPAEIAQLYDKAFADLNGVPYTSPELSVSTSRHGITVTIQEVEYYADSTIMTVLTQVDPMWGMSPRTDPAQPPQTVQVRDLVLTTADGNSIRPRKGSGVPIETDPATGGVWSEGRLTFDPLPPNVGELTLAVNVELMLPAAAPLQIDLMGREVGERWTLSESIVVKGVPVPIETVELIEEGGITYLRLTAPVVTQDGITITCFYLSVHADTGLFNPEGGFDCHSGSQITSSFAMTSLPEQVTLDVYGNVEAAEPWTLSWPVESRE